MNAAQAEHDRGNPFSTRYVRPGALPYLFSSGETVSDVLQRLADNNWLGQIVGPHGSGKSTLLAALRSAIEAAGKKVVFIELHDGQRRLPREAVGRVATRRGGWVPWPRSRGHAPKQHDSTTMPGHDPAYHNAAQVLVIDGYEQLPWWRRWCLQRRCRRHRVGLLVTTHRSVGLPDIFRTHIEPDIAQRVVSELLSAWPDLITREEVTACVERHGQDLREALFELYDLFEQRRQKGT